MKRREKRERKAYFRRAGFAAAFAAAAVIASGTPAYAKTTKKVAITPSVVTVYTGKTKKLTLKNNTKKVKWSASSKAVTLSKKGKKGVTVTGKKAGTATVSAIIGKKKYKAKITVKKTGLSTTKITMKAGTSYTLKLNGDPAKTWNSSSVSAVKISSQKAGSARLTAVKAGKSVITAKTAKGKKYRCTVTVKAAKNASSSKAAQPKPSVKAPASSTTSGKTSGSTTDDHYVEGRNGDYNDTEYADTDYDGWSTKPVNGDDRSPIVIELGDVDD